MIRDNLVFRGGTALNKLFLKSPTRYSEDLDFVQKESAPIGPIIDTIRNLLQPWLGEPKRKLTQRSVKLIYQYEATGGLPAKLKIEINTTEHFQVLPLHIEPLAVSTEWFEGNCMITTYALEELMATKLRALYQRRKGRDLFDLWYVITQNVVDTNQMIEIFKKYCAHDDINISQKLFKENMEMKRLHRDFRVDMNVLLAPSIQWNFDEAFSAVHQHIINKLS
jgi:predicted nucleotidyltransferase component of viral defense system